MRLKGLIFIVISLISANSWAGVDTLLQNKNQEKKFYSTFGRSEGVHQFVNVTYKPYSNEAVEYLELIKNGAFSFDYSLHRKFSNRFNAFFMTQLVSRKQELQFILVENNDRSGIINGRQSHFLATYLGAEATILERKSRYYAGAAIGYQFSNKNTHYEIGGPARYIIDFGGYYKAKNIRGHIGVATLINEKRFVHIELSCALNKYKHQIVNTMVLPVNFYGNSLQYGIRVAVSSRHYK